jgi:hypothetical protein
MRGRRFACFALVLVPSLAWAQAARPPESVTVTGTKSREVLQKFVGALAAPARFTGKMARWKEPVCPVTVGLKPAFVQFINRRLKQVAAQVGAPVSERASCRTNIEIVFTTTPQSVADDLRKNHYPFLGYFDNFGQADELAKVTHDIQAWYTTATVERSGLLRVDNPRGDLMSAGTFNGLGQGHVYYAPGAGRFNVGPASSLYNVIIVANPARLGEYEMGALADYIAMLALSQPKSFDACWEVPSITNLLSKACQAERKTATLSDNDTRFLYGLYKMDGNYAVQVQRSQIRYFMEHRSADKQ